MYRILDKKLSKDDANTRFESGESKIKGIDKNILKLSGLFERLEVRISFCNCVQSFTENIALAVKNLESASLKGIINSSNLTGYLRQ